MDKTGTGLGIGLAALVAVCCGGHLLLLAGLPILAASTGQAWLVAVATVVALAGLGIFVLRRRSGSSSTTTAQNERPEAR